MKKKRTAIVVAGVLIAVFLAGCKKNVGTPEDNPVQEEAEETVSAEEYTFAYVCNDLSDPFYDVLKESVRSGLEEQKHTLIIKDSAQDAALQVKQLRELAESGVDGVFLCPSDEATIASALANLDEAGIPVINLGEPLKKDSLADIHIGSEERNAGKVCGEDLAQRKPEGGRVLIVENSGSSFINERVTGFEEAIRNKGFEVIKRLDSGKVQNGLTEAIRQLLEQERGIDAVMCGDDNMAKVVLEVMEEISYADAAVYSVGGSPQIKGALADPESPMTGIGALSPIGIGKEAVKAATDLAAQKSHQNEISVETFLITRDNLDIYGTDGWQ